MSEPGGEKKEQVERDPADASLARLRVRFEPADVRLAPGELVIVALVYLTPLLYSVAVSIANFVYGFDRYRDFTLARLDGWIDHEARDEHLRHAFVPSDAIWEWFGIASMMLGPVALVLYLAAKANGSWRGGLRSLGVGSRCTLVEFMLGCLLAVALLVLGSALDALLDVVAGNTGLWWIALSEIEGPPAPVQGLLALVIVIPSLILVASGEELICRGFLMPRLLAFGLRPGFVVFASSAVFASYHLYQGLPGLLGAFLFGAVWGLVYLWTGRLWIAIVAHAVYNVIVILDLVPPWLGG